MKVINSDQFLERLLAVKGVTQDEIQAVKDKQESEPTLLVSEALREIQDLAWEPFVQLLCEEMGCEYMPAEMLRNLPVQDAAISRVDSATARELAVYPVEFDEERNRLMVVTAYPFNPTVLGELTDVIGIQDIEATFCSEKILHELIHKAYVGEAELFDAEAAEVGFDLGVGSDEEAFPGLYGSNVNDYLYEEPADDGGAATQVGGGIRGSLADMGIIELLQALGQSRKTCSVFVDSAEGPNGSIYLLDGNVCHAELEDESGEEAVYRILAFDEGSFEVINREYPGDPSMMQPVEGLLMEAMRRLDEANR